MSDSKETISFRLDRRQRQALDTLAMLSSRKRSDLISDALQAYIDVQKWQCQEISLGIKEADAGDFASEDEAKKMFSKLTKDV
jgi:predicted transcriptional regulator